MTIKDIILEAWASCKNEEERGKVLGQIDAARHEIRYEYLWAEPELLRTIALLENKLDGIMRGQYRIAPVELNRHDCGCGREAPLVGLAGYVAMLLAMRAEQRARIGSEVSGSVTHAARLGDAIKARSAPARPGRGMTTYMEPPSSTSVGCRICQAAAGDPCKS